MKQEQNPFPTIGYAGPSYFCDREKELSTLSDLVINGNNITMFSVRRLGKTGLLKHFFHKYEKQSGAVCLYVDIFGTRSLREFCGRIATAIYEKFPEKVSAGRKILRYVRLLRPVISYDDLTGKPEVSFEIGRTNTPEKTLEQIFSILEKQKAQVVIALDEFQQILQYPEKNTEALLRTHMQHARNIRFVFSGSNLNMMHEIFQSAHRPFYASCSNITLQHIDPQKYRAFIRKQFVKHKRSIDDESLEFIMEWTTGHTWYTQYFCNYVFLKNITAVTKEHTLAAAAELLEQQQGLFFQYRTMLTVNQWDLLSAIAGETRLFRPHAGEFLKKYRLGTSSMVTRGIQSLLVKEMVLHNTSVEAPYYEVYDKFLMRWLQRTQMVN
jgi:AAA+ ATPase superfamily predicted ATPase